MPRQLQYNVVGAVKRKVLRVGGTQRGSDLCPQGTEQACAGP